MFSYVKIDVRHLRIVGEEMFDEMEGEILDCFGGILTREDVNRILDGVRRKNRAIVARRERGGETALESRRHSEIFNLMQSAAVHDPEEANARFAIIVLREFN